jgi:hypothetical protein
VDQSRAASITAVVDLDSIKPLIDELDATTSISVLGFASKKNVDLAPTELNTPDNIKPLIDELEATTSISVPQS